MDFSAVKPSSAISEINENPDRLDIQGRFIEYIKQLHPKDRLQTIRRVLDTHKHHKWLTQVLALALTANGEHESAIKIWTDFFDKEPDNVYIRSGLKSALKPLKPLSRINILKSLRRCHPNSLYLQENLGLEFLANNEFSQAIPLFNACLQAQGYRRDVFENLLVAAYIGGQDFDKALNILETALGREPDNTNFKLSLCQVLTYRGDPYAAIEVCVTQLTKHPKDSSDFLILLRKIVASFDENVRISIWKELVLEHTGIVSFCEELFGALKASQDPSVCANVLKEILCANPKLPGFCALLQQTLDAGEEQDMKVDTWASLLESHPGQADFREALCVALNTCGNDEKAVGTWTKLLARHPKCEEFQLELRKAKAKLAGVDLDVACTICFDRDMDTVLYECGHTYCSVCAGKLVNCPECRLEVRDRIRVFARLFHR